MRHSPSALSGESMLLPADHPGWTDTGTRGVHPRKGPRAASATRVVTTPLTETEDLRADGF